MAAGRILVIAPDSDLSGSLAFTLEAEGYEVTASAQLPDYGWMRSKGFDATVLDQTALRGEDEQSIAFCVKARPVVLLAARPHPWLVQWVADVVDMPVRGSAVSTAVDRVTHTGA
jgi:DNA-binding NtrC family response regulator